MPQFDISSFPVQILWLFILLVTMYIFIGYKFLPKTLKNTRRLFLLTALLWPLLDVGTTWAAYILLSGYAYRIMFTLAFTVGNLAYLNALFNTSYGRENFKTASAGKSSVSQTLEDLQEMWKQNQSILRTFSFFFFLIGSLSLYGILLLLCLFYLLSMFCNPICIVVFYAMSVNTLYALLWAVNSMYKRFVKPFVENMGFSHVFSMSSYQVRICAFFKKNEQARRDPFVLFLGLSAFLRESNLCFLLMYVFFFRADGGLSFCLCASFFILVSVVTLLPCTRRVLFRRYGADCLKDLAYNEESFFFRRIISKGPRAAAIIGGVAIGLEIAVQSTSTIEQFGINCRYSIRASAANAAADNAGVDRPTPLPIPEAPRRSILFRTTEKGGKPCTKVQ